MFKFMVIAFALALSPLAQAAQGSLKCSIAKSDASFKNFDGAGFTLETRLLSISKQDDGKIVGGMWDPIATYEADGADLQIGRKDNIWSDKDYSPRKYKNTLRFTLTDLVDSKIFGFYYPDMCSIKIMIPVDAIEQGSFKAAAIMNCDQSGGTKTLDCTTTPRQD